MAEQVNTNQFKNGMHIELDGGVWRIVEFQHVKPGKGGAFVRTKLKSLGSGSVVDKTFRAGEKFPRVRTEVKSVQFLYDDGDSIVWEVPARPKTAKALTDKKITILMQLSLSKHPDLPDVPLVTDLAKTDEQRQILRLIFARQVMGRPYLAPPNEPRQ